MKTSFLFLLLAFACCSCQNNNDDNLLTNASQTAVSGSWRITLFTDSGKNETSDYTAYTFAFNSDGTLTAARSGTTQTGTWSTRSSSNKFIIDLGPKTNKPLGELTDDWKILSISSTEIRLGDDNSASDEFLTFTKN